MPPVASMTAVCLCFIKLSVPSIVARGLAQSRARHRLADAVYLRLVETRELPLRAVRGLHEVARLLHRHEVFISRHTSPFYDGATGRPENEAASREFSSSHAFISPSP